MSDQRGICQRSGFEFPMAELVKEWTGLLVHRRFVDKRNPQDLLRAARETPPPRTFSPEPADVFVNQVLTGLDPLVQLTGLDNLPLTSIGVTY